MRAQGSPGKYVALVVITLCVASVGLGLARRAKILVPTAQASAARPASPTPRQSDSTPDVPCQEPPLRQRPKPQSSLARDTKFGIAEAGGAAPSNASARTNYLSLFNVKMVRVEDAAGRAENLFTGQHTAQRPESVSYDFNGGGSLMIMTPADKTYTVTFQPGDIASMLDLIRGLNNEVPDLAVRYNDLVLPKGSTAMIKVTPQGIEPLRLDKDGDGTFETVLPPDAAVSGRAANDVRGPTLCFGQSERGGATFVTIAAADSSGVKAIYYSLDAPSKATLDAPSEEMSFQLYAGPFRVDPARTPVVSAFADDKVGNRGGVAEYKVAAKR